MPAESFARFLSAVTNSRILSAEQLGEVHADLRSRCPDPVSLGRALIERGWATAFQVNRVHQGRGDDLRVGPYLLLGRLGRGSMGKVFKARHVTMQRVAALKLIRPGVLVGPDRARRFLRETQALARLDHPNIVHPYDAGAAGDRGHYLAMEYVEGVDLKALVLRDGPLGPADAAEYARQAALGLQHACERGIVHRDLKPSNLMLASGGTVKVLDLGLARVLPCPGEADDPLTAAGQVLGSVDYISPEQVLNSHGA